MDFEKSLSNIHKRNYLDSGSGLGIAALEISKRYDAQVFAINVQDMWQKLFELKTTLDAHPTRGFYSYLSNNFSLNSSDFDNFSFLLYGKHTKMIWHKKKYISESLKITYIDIIEKVTKLYSRQKEKQSFNYIVGYSEKVLKNYDKKFRLISDVFGAFFYSPLKHELLELYYKSLDKNGEAFICIAGDKIHNSKTLVIQNKKKIDFYHYIINKYPSIFTIHQDENIKPSLKIRFPMHYPSGHVLKIKKDPSIDKIDLSLGILTIEDYVDKEYKVSFPKVIFKTK